MELRRATLWLLCFCCTIFLAHCQKLTHTIQTNFGNVRGLQIQPPVPGLHPVQAFLGIPYGTPTTGNSRFTMPHTAARWTNMEKNATELPPVCVQQFPPDIFEPELALLTMPDSRYRYFNRLRGQLNKENENCLFMNIYVPVRTGQTPKAPLPVLVLVHGESYMWNSGNAYNASILASHGQIIVITLNYRLGVLGFLSSGRESCRGNWAMSDILCALQFLREFIPSFGGDPQAITLMGWGTGAAIVNLLMSSPMSAPAESRLFKRAILLGGSSLSSWAMVDQQTASNNFYRLAENAGCPTTAKGSASTRSKNPEFLPEEEILECIRSRPVFNLTKSAQMIPNPSFLSNFGPVIDGTSVPSDPNMNLEKHGNLFRGLDLMVGLTSNEAYNLLNQKQAMSGIDALEKKKIYRTLTRNLFSYHLTEIYEAIATEYRNWRDPEQTPTVIRDSVLHALSDALYNAPAVKTAQLHSKSRNAGDQDTQTYLYVFAHKTSSTDRGKGIDDSVSNEDLPYILGYPLLNSGDMDSMNIPFEGEYTAEEREISEAMMTYVSNFVKKGSPLHPIPLTEIDPSNNRQKARKISQKLNEIRWPRFDSSQQESFLYLSAERQKIGRFYRAEKVAFWNKLVPALQKTGQDKTVPPEHNFLPDHFKKKEYYGLAKPMYGQYSDMPFPPPPLAPPNMPSDLVTKANQEKMKEKNEDGDTATPITSVNGVQYSTILSVTVAVGCALLVLNILIFAGICHQRDKHKRTKKQMQMHYQSYDSASGAYLNSPLASSGPRMPPAPPPPGTTVSSHSHTPQIENDTHPAISVGGTPQPGSRLSTPSGTTLRTFHQQPLPQHHHSHHHPSGGVLRGQDMHGSGGIGYPEQEPLLSGTGTRGVSPSCPRHGRAAMAVANSGPVEEIQV